MENDSLLESQGPITPLDVIDRLHERTPPEENVQDKPFVFVNPTDRLDSLVSNVFYDWNLPSPDIIISLISGTRSYTAWKHGDHRAALQKGIIKLIKATETWLIDIGLDYGLSKTIGDAVRNEQSFRRSVDRKEVFARGYFKRRRHGITLFGIAPVAVLEGYETDDDSLDNYAHRQDKFGLNASHTHYIFVNGKYKEAKKFRVTVERELARQAALRRSPTLLQEKKTPESDVKMTVIHEAVPLLAILIQGDHVELDQVLEYLRNGFPVLIIRGTGFLADVLAFAFEEGKDRLTASKDLEQLKSELSKKLSRSFCEACMQSDTDRIVIRDKIVECVQLAVQDDCRLITITDSSDDLVDIQDSVLTAIFASRNKSMNSSKEQLRSDFLLTMRLNKPGLAESKVLARDEAGVFQVDNQLFEKALIWKDREHFIERFLDEDFCIHKFLNHSVLLRLFRRGEDNEFFITVVWEQLPRHHHDFQVDESFVTIGLNVIVQKLTGLTDYVSMFELTSSFLGRYVEDEYTAERKAMNALMLWALLMNRFNLLRVLWKFCENPIPTALFISAMYRGLAKHCSAPSLVSQITANSRTFSGMAIDVLDMSYKESHARTFDLLNQRFTDFNDKTVLKLAYMSKNKYFLSHEACQVWLNWLWNGGIEITETWESRIPEEVKLILSALFIFPICAWIRFPVKNFARHKLESMEAPAGDVTDSSRGPSYSVRQEAGDRFHIYPAASAQSENTERLLLDLKTLESRCKKKASYRSILPKSSSHGSYVNGMAFWKKVYYLWTTPRTKFWMSQVFYWVYLGLFSFATIMPTCNDYDLDVAVVIWTFFILLEILLRTVTQSRHGFPVNLFRRALEIVFMSSFVLFVSIMKLQFGLLRPHYMRAWMAVGLLYMYYRMMSEFFPMNAVLGPMLYRIKRMVCVDFFLFVRLSMPFVLANMFALQAVMYPDLPLGAETIRKGFYRAFFTLFISFVSEIDRKEDCEETRLTNTTDMCWVGDYANPHCPHIGFSTYALNIQFLVIMRLILVVLLNALFAATMIKVKEDAEHIFKYERYGTVLDFASRPALPPPLTFFNYLFNGTVLVMSKFNRMNDRQKANLTTLRMVKLIEKKAAEKRSTNSYSYWMGLTKEYYRKKVKEDKEKKAMQENITRLKSMAEEQKLAKNLINRLSDKIKEGEQKLIAYMESIKNGMERKDIPKESQSCVNVLSRVSPYPGTDIKRYLVADHDVLWPVKMDIYEPPYYSKPVEDFPTDEQPFTDPVITVNINALSTDPLLRCWNSTCLVGDIFVDRRSILKGLDGENLMYGLAENGLPRNPVGRTGLCGRGCLHRYGPNHRVKTVVSRMKDGKLMVLVAKGYPAEVPVLFPKIALTGGKSVFEAVCEIFASMLVPVEDMEAKGTQWETPYSVEEMHSALQAMASEGAETNTDHCLEIEEIYGGYQDDPKNTDNAWLELFVWHVHILPDAAFARQRHEKYVWKEPVTIRNASPMEERILEMVVNKKGSED
ncbi:transient receptor potential cation channel subfamily M member 1-like isoform X2 [Paramacrobiotus metropolitanus]|nr:transient receptor potential cation channel subfamily M member 1-like isoform X2 [Paramacrobiotus metropolitanus]XP_055345658.1 transient receptor potential cation channel subfamily M member 1-like isoform X2 [Paramacrobiotus metropolitanus]